MCINEHGNIKLTLCPRKKHMDESKTNVNVKLSNKTLKKVSNRKFYSYRNPTSIANYQIVTYTRLQSR
jgi:hypothetical protein